MVKNTMKSFTPIRINKALKQFGFHQINNSGFTPIRINKALKPQILIRGYLRAKTYCDYAVNNYISIIHKSLSKI